jgi:hypothetical protein
VGQLEGEPDHFLLGQAAHVVAVPLHEDDLGRVEVAAPRVGLDPPHAALEVVLVRVHGDHATGVGAEA